MKGKCELQTQGWSVAKVDEKWGVKGCFKIQKSYIFKKIKNSFDITKKFNKLVP